MKLRKLIENIYEENEINEEEFLNDVSNYSSFGKNIYREGNISDTCLLYTSPSPRD